MYVFFGLVAPSLRLTHRRHRVESSLQVGGHDAVAVVERLHHQLHTDPRVEGMEIEPIIQKAAERREELAKIEKEVNGWKTPDYEKLRSEAATLMQELKKDQTTLIDLHEGMLIVKEDVSEEKSVVNHRVRTARDKLAAIFEKGQCPKLLARAIANRLQPCSPEQRLEIFQHWASAGNLFSCELEVGTEFRRPLAVVYGGSDDTYYHGYLNTVFNGQADDVAALSKKAETVLRKNQRTHAYKPLGPLRLGVNPPAASGDAEGVATVFDTVGDFTPILYVMQTTAYLPIATDPPKSYIYIYICQICIYEYRRRPSSSSSSAVRRLDRRASVVVVRRSSSVFTNHPRSFSQSSILICLISWDVSFLGFSILRAIQHI